LMRSIDLNDARAKLPRTLESRNTLLVLDDVWDVEHVSALANAAGPLCRILMTTRDGSIATSFGAREHSVDLLSNQTARLLLASWVEVSEPDLPAEARQVMLECGNLPLALALCGAMVRDGTPWQDVVQALRSADLTFVEAKLPNYEYPNMLRALQTSVDMLSRDEPDTVARYLELATFREERAVPEAAVITLWCRHGILSEAGSRKLLTKLARKSLLRIETEQPRGGAFGGRTISLHDLQYDYVYARNENAAELRAALLGAYREKCAGDWWSCPADGYFHLRLMGLLHEVEGAKACRRLLLDFRWLDAKTRATDIAELLQDFAFGEPADGVVSAIERALRHAAHLLTFGEGANQLGSQLMARLLGQNEPEINRLCEQAHQVRSAAGGPWLRPLTASLREPSALLRTLAAHAGGVTALAVLPDGRLLSGGADKTIRIWNIETGKAEAALAGHTGTVWALTLLPDGRVASGCGDDTVDLWMNLDRLPGDTTDHHVIKIWNLLTGRVESTLRGHTGTVWALVPLPEGRLASGSAYGSIKIWNLRMEEVEREMAEFVSALALAPDGRLLSLSWGSAKLWDWRTGEAHEIVDDYHGSPLVPLTILPGGMFALGRNDHSIGIIDLDGTYRTNWRVPLPAGSSVSVLAGAFRRNLVGHTSWVSALTGLQGGRLASGSKDGTIKLWNLTTATVEATLHAHSTRVTALAALPGKRLASASLDGTIRFWNVAGTEFEQALDKHERSVRTLLLLPDGRMAAGTDDGIIGLWNVAARRLETKLAGHTSSVRALLMLSPETLLSGSWDATVRVWNLKTGETEAIIKTTDAGWGREVNALAMLGGKRLAAACGDKTVKVWNLQSSETEPPLPHPEYVLCLLPLDEQRLFSGGGGDCAIRLWNLETRQVEVVLRGHSSDVSTLAMARDGRLLSGSWDATMRIWTPGIAESLQPLVGHTDAIWAVLPLADGSIISASRDGTIRLWSEGEGGWKSAPVFIAGSGVTSLLLIESSAVVVAGDASGRVHFLRLEH
jgi:WD40 repeat protein